MSIASTGTTGNNFRYSGEWLEPNLRFYNLRAPYYNAHTGRFETMDPGKDTCCATPASQVGNVFDPRSLRKYVYAGNDPVNRVDPTGKDAEEEASIYESVVQPVVRFLNTGIIKDFLYIEGVSCLAFQVYRETPQYTNPTIEFANAFCYVAEGLAVVGGLPQPPGQS